METKSINPFSIPAAIVIAGTIVAIAIIWSKNPAPAVPKAPTQDQGVTINLSPVNASDHIFGNPNAAIKIVEYSDPSCPYCKQFNPTMEDVISQYGPTGNVAWVYRHFPLDKPDANGNILHKNAGHEAQAMECAADVGGNDKFWAFEKKLYETTPSVTGATPNGLDQTQLPVIAKAVGIDVTAFNDCLGSGKFSDAVEKEYLTGVNAGVSGTPTSFIVLNKPAGQALNNYIGEALISYKIPSQLLYVSSDMKTIAMSGALPKELITGLITAIQNN
jgi:protein-disulfide isomerase